MKKCMRIQAVCAALVLTVSVSVTALAVPQLVTAKDNGNGYSFPKEWQYTQADLQLVQGLKTANYAGLSLAEFDRKAADWDDETAFHRMEEALGRLRHSYPEDGELYGFIDRTLLASFRESSAKHYGGKCDRVTPYFYDQAVRVRTADVYGDTYDVFEADAGYVLSYRVTDETKTTVAQRDKLLDDYQAAVKAFLAGKTEKQLLDEDAMEKALKAELKRLDKTIKADGIVLDATELDYYWCDGYEDNGT